MIKIKGKYLASHPLYDDDLDVYSFRHLYITDDHGYVKTELTFNEVIEEYHKKFGYKDTDVVICGVYDNIARFNNKKTGLTKLKIIYKEDE